MNRFAFKRYALTAFLISLAIAPEWFVAATAGPSRLIRDPFPEAKEQQERLGLQIMVAKL